MHAHITAGTSAFTHPVMAASHFLTEGSYCLFGKKTVLVMFTDLENVCMWVISAFKSFHMTNMSYLQTRIWKVKSERSDLNKKRIRIEIYGL